MKAVASPNSKRYAASTWSSPTNGDRLLGALLAASVVVVLVGWVSALVYLFGFHLL